MLLEGLRGEPRGPVYLGRMLGKTRVRLPAVWWGRQGWCLTWISKSIHQTLRGLMCVWSHTKAFFHPALP